MTPSTPRADIFLRNSLKLPIHRPGRGLAAPEDTRKPTDVDFTLLAGSGGEILLRLDEGFQGELERALEERTKSSRRVEQKYMWKAQAFDQFTPNVSIRLEKTLEGLIVTEHCAVIRSFLAATQAGGLPRYLTTANDNFAEGRFHQTGARNELTPAEIVQWRNAVLRLTDIRSFITRHGTTFLRNREEFRPVPIGEGFALPRYLTTGSAFPDITYTLPIDATQPKVLLVVEVKLHSVLKEEHLVEFVERMERSGGIAHLTLCRVSLPAGSQPAGDQPARNQPARNQPAPDELRVFSEFGVKMTRVISQVYTELAVSKTRVAIVTNGQKSIVFEWGNGGMRISKPIDHNSGMSLLELLCALILYTSHPEYNRADYPKPANA